MAKRRHSKADRAAVKLQADIKRAFDAVRDGTSEAMLEQDVRQQSIRSLDDIISRLTFRLKASIATLQRLYRDMVAEESQGLRDAGLSIRFDAFDTDAIMATRESAKFVTFVTEATRDSLREIMGRVFSEGIPPREAAQLIKSVIGLTPKQAAKVYRTRTALLSAGSSKQEAGRKAYILAQRLLRERSLTIARTETIGASTRGQLSAWRRARKQGLLPQATRKGWMVTPDDRLCPRCAAMDGQTVRLDAQFLGPNGERVDGPPLHQRCRCAVFIASNVVPLQGVA